MRTQSLFAAAAIVVVFSTAVLAAQSADSGRLDGEYFIYSLDLGDTLPPTSKDAKINIAITGRAALEMFKHLGARAKLKDECGIDGLAVRRRGDLECREIEVGRFECSFGLNLKTGKSINGTIC